MRSYGAAALILLAIVTECLSAERSRQRSGPVRSVPVTATIKREVDFDCPEEFGYYPHPTDCTLYYVCVFGGALLESCTGGLMYSHELQTCDWPRNVGCDGASAAGGDEIERLNERDRRPPPPPPPRRTPAPPPPRAQPSPVVTSRGQPKFNREEYEKQQQLYVEVDDLPPVEEIESDRQQRVYRGQPSTIGQVQKDRDGYAALIGGSGRNYNTNIIPASIPQSHKIGSFSFGSQVDDRRKGAVTRAPESYSDNDNLTDSHDDNIDVDTNNIDDTNNKTLSRRKRDVVDVDLSKSGNVTNKTDEISKKNDEAMEYFDMEFDENLDDNERNKRQVRYYLKNGPGYSKPGKNWVSAKPIKYIEVPQNRYPNTQNTQNLRYTPIRNNNYYENNRRPSSYDSNSYSASNPFYIYQTDNSQQRPFKASLPDYSNNQNPLNIATQIITKSPPISALHNSENPFSTSSGSYYGSSNAYQNNNQFSAVTLRPTSQVSYKDSSLLPSTVVTGKPIQSSTLSAIQNKKPKDTNQSEESEEYYDGSDEEYSDEEDDDFKPDFKPPYEFSNPRHKYADIENPFANPNFDFDAFLDKLSNGQYLTQKHNGDSKPKQEGGSTSVRPNTNYKSTYLDYKGMSTPSPFGPKGHEVIIKPSPNTPKQSNSAQSYQNQQRLIDSQNMQQQLSYAQAIGSALDATKFKIKPPNFNDDRELPISFSFRRPSDTNTQKQIEQSQASHSGTQKPYIFLTATASPIVFSTPKQQYFVNYDKVVSFSPHGSSTGKPYLVSSVKPHNEYMIYKHTTPSPMTTLANKQLKTLQQFWGNVSTESISSQYVTAKPSTTQDLSRLKTLFAQAIASSPRPQTKSQNLVYYKDQILTTTQAPPKRRPIPKPSPEMKDCYYDDEDEYFEPLVKPKYMPSTEVKPQRPPMAQNYKEYDDDSSEQSQDKRPFNNLNAYMTQYKEYIKNNNGKIPVPVSIDFVSSTPSSINSPNVSNVEMIHRYRNKTVHYKPAAVSGPHTLKPPKFLNQTTLRPYTVRHRLAKPTKATESSDQNRGRLRHPNIVAQMLTTPRDSHNQETRYTKTKHDGRTNSLEPTESIDSYRPSPRPKLLYNGAQNYSSDQYDPYYAIYDEDGELYKDSDYVQYNMAPARPAVQQNYRGTPSPAPSPAPSPVPPRRPVQVTYSPRPSTEPEDYDNILLQGQLNDENQYHSTPGRHSNRGDGNELGYEHPSREKTTIYEAPIISTNPPTTSTSTTQRPTTAPYTEPPTRPTSRSSTDENPIPNSDSFSNQNSSDESVSSIPSTIPSVINFSSLAKPFERTDNLHRLEDVVSTTEKIINSRTYVTNNNDHSVEVVRSEPKNENKNVVSLTTGFSIRRNLNNSNNPYTLTVLTRPLADYDKPGKDYSENVTNVQSNSDRYYYDSSSESNEKLSPSTTTTTTTTPTPTVKTYEPKSTLRRKDSRFVVTDDYDIPVNYRPSSRTRPKPKAKSTTPPASTTKYYLKSIIKRPAPFSKNENEEIDSENPVNLDALIDTGLQNAQVSNNEPTTQNPSEINITPKRKYNVRIENDWDVPTESSFKPLDNSKTIFKQNEPVLLKSSTTSTTTTAPTFIINENKEKPSKPKSTYYSYRVEDEIVPNDTTEALSSTVKNVIRAFFGNFGSTPASPRLIEYISPSTTPFPQTSPKIVNIGFQKKPQKHTDEKPLKKNVNRLQIISEPSATRFRIPFESLPEREAESIRSKDFSSTTSTMTTLNTTPLAITSPPTTPIIVESSTFGRQFIPSYQSKFSEFITSAPEPIETTPSTETSRKFQSIISVLSENDNNQKTKDESTLEEKTLEPTRPADIDWNNSSDNIKSEIASTTSTTKSTTTTTLKIDSTKATSKLASFPTRASRVNPAIKLAASNPGSGRRSYQSSSKCSSDNSLQANPKCNEIKYQRPVSTRGRGSAHYSTLSGNESPQQTPNRGTPPTRTRPTLKPSTSIVSKSTEFLDIYANPPSRPAPVYPQPTPDKTAAKCRKDVCLLPDCYCGGKDIPGDLPVEQVPQIVLLTFDDSVNDLNKGLYTDLFEKGRVNPNGCPISATFYVSHEWTDYSQVQNLYAAGHEMASHTISHSFGEQFSQKKWNREVAGQREILAAYGGVKLEDVRGMRAPFLSIGGNKMFKMLYDSNFTYDSSMPVYENRPPSWPYTLDYKLFHDCMIPPCPTKSYPGVWEVPMVMWQDLNGGRCSMGDACANPPEAEGVYKMLLKNFDRHYTTNRAPFGLYYHAAWFTQPHHKEGFIMFLDFINQMQDVWIVTNWQALQWVRDPTPISRLNNFQPFQCNYQDRPKKCNNPKVCNLWHKSGVRYMRTCQPCPEVYPWTGKTGIRSSRIDNDNGE